MRFRFGIFHKFGLLALLAGFLPMSLAVLIAFTAMHSSYIDTLKASYTQSVSSLQERVDAAIESYDTILSMPYYYSFGEMRNYRSSDVFRQVLYGEIYSPETMEEERAKDITAFLQNIIRSDSYIRGAHFIGRDRDGNELSFYMNATSSYLQESRMGHATDEASKGLMILSGSDRMEYGAPVFTLARNYFDIRTPIGEDILIGTLYIDVDLSRIRYIVSSAASDGTVASLLADGRCWYSSDSFLIGTDYDPVEVPDGRMVFYCMDHEYPLEAVLSVDTSIAFRSVNLLMVMMSLLLTAATVIFITGVFLASRRFSRQVGTMMRGMDRIGQGDLDVALPVSGSDEIAEVSERFSSMARKLKAYIDKAYTAQLRQREAEITALKSQIYPHFLYNTLEVIRMTAASEGDEKTALMIEALSEQMHYLIGRPEDSVPLGKEIDIVRKYIYLINCRTGGSIMLSVSGETEGIIVPKLILQPVVENSYIHGIKPRGMKGRIAIETRIEGSDVVISVLDNGVGMDEKQLEAIRTLFAGNDIGIKDEYAWKSIGLKNVYDRIRLLYGEGYSLSVDSSVGVGTVVTITLPLMRAVQ